ncbi:hypothetical protein [Acinetobacter sp. WCHAc060025]|uniref:hypothetical protein n=1 Tax=Acinetobacter sp. WCHAc060025 TaxID=2518625 RepID=UPI001023E8EC|nr:hypothetical protein [Acinetobacter sp. WCHAc060025]RZG77751.1 hypothetical protein EXE09_02200 [Acinetobacter sp. WCHAc060025]
MIEQLTSEELKTIETITYLKNWFESCVNTINGAADSDAQSVKLQGGDGKDDIEITGRDKNMFLAGLKTAGSFFGKFPISIDTPEGSFEITTDSKRLEFLVQNRLRVEKWNTTPNHIEYFVYDDEDKVIAQDFTHRDAIDKAMESYLEA